MKQSSSDSLRRHPSSRPMQKIIRTAIAITLLFSAAIGAHAQESELYFINASGMKKVFVSEAIDVVLVAAKAGDEVLKMTDATSRKLRVYTTENSIHITGASSYSNERPVLYLTVGRLEALTVDGNVKVQTPGMLSTGKMDVYVGGDCKLQLKTDSKVRVHAFGDAEVRYEIRDLSTNHTTKKTA